jgi:hypothetical protein
VARNRLDKPGRNLARARVAHLAARLIAVDGVADFATAKQKAARQAGLGDDEPLPDNQEIEDALRAYQGLFQQDEHPQQLRWLRGIAVEAMRLLAEFDPHLTGSVLNGTAGPDSDVNIQVFADDCKEVELLLINRGIRYRPEERSVRRGDRKIAVPLLRIEREGAEVAIAVLAPNDLRVQRRSADGRAIERARLAQVEAMIAATPDS